MTWDELLKEIGLSKHTIRHYMKLGLLSRPTVEYKGPGNVITHFQNDTPKRIAVIQMLKKAGQTLAEIKEVLPKTGVFQEATVYIPEYLLKQEPPRMMLVQESVGKKASVSPDPELPYLTDEQILEFVKGQGWTNRMIYNFMRREYAKARQELQKQKPENLKSEVDEEGSEQSN